MRTILSLVAVSMMLLSSTRALADDHEFLDLNTGLTWSPSMHQMGFGAGSYSYATSVAANISTTNYNDWRLPTRAELQQAVANGTINHINTTSIYAPWTGGRAFWTSDKKGNKQWTVIIRFNIDPFSSVTQLVSVSSTCDAYLVRP